MRLPRFSTSAAILTMAVLTLVLGLTLAGQQRSDSPQASYVEAAKKEGKVVHYNQGTAQGRTTPIQSVLKGMFERKYPDIWVEWVTTPTSEETTRRLFQEYETGTAGADVTIMAGGTLREATEKPNMIAKHVPRDTAWLPGELKDSDGKWAAYVIQLIGVGYNTKLVGKGDVPTTYQDLLDPKWAGKIGAVDPQASAPAAIAGYAWKTMETRLGDGFIKKLALQKLKYYRSAPAATEKLANGDISILWNVPIGNFELGRDAGWPVEWVRWRDNTYVTQSQAPVITGKAPHPNAAKLWVDFLFSKEAQQVLADWGNTATMPGLRLANPDLDLKGKRLVPSELVPFSKAGAFLKTFSAKYGLAFP